MCAGTSACGALLRNRPRSCCSQHSAADVCHSFSAPGTLLLTYGAKIAVFTKLVVPAVTAIAAGAVTVAVATRIGNAMAQRPQADDDGAIDAEASSSSSPASALGGRGRGAAQQDQRAGSAPVVEQEIDLAAEEFRLFDERLLGSDPSQWCAAASRPLRHSAVLFPLLSVTSPLRAKCSLVMSPCRSSGEVAVWLQKAGFGAYADAFRAQDVDGRVLLSLGAYTVLPAALSAHRRPGF